MVFSKCMWQKAIQKHCFSSFRVFLNPVLTFLFSVKDKQYPVVMYGCISIKAFNCKCELQSDFF